MVVPTFQKDNVVRHPRGMPQYSVGLFPDLGSESRTPYICSQYPHPGRTSELASSLLFSTNIRTSLTCLFARSTPRICSTLQTGRIEHLPSDITLSIWRQLSRQCLLVQGCNAQIPLNSWLDR